VTIASETTIARYTGNGSTDTFAYTWRIYAASELVVKTITTAGVVTTHVLDSTYSVTGVGTATGGNVVFTDPPTDGHGVVIDLDPTFTQTTDLANESNFFQDRIETGLDKVARLAQVADRHAGVIRAISVSFSNIAVGGTDTNTGNFTEMMPGDIAFCHAGDEYALRFQAYCAAPGIVTIQAVNESAGLASFVGTVNVFRPGCQ
jgi:hypothetical protein